MSDIVISVENLSKMYRLGRVNSGSFGADINRWWSRISGKEDPYSKLAIENDRTQKSESEYVWALRDISFELKKGEVLGVVGRNGAGKSTLLKMLTRITLPTTGSIKAKGRMASLLEVGTGFHPDLTGRENVFLNGAILGMRKSEIKQKFDEIVDFSGVEKYIDTPVKRYSSGMYVRLAFAVAAHLESEILIIDEVLAVGDAEFQKKCLGKMSDVASNQGRTVLFVSHNLNAVRRLCNKGLLLANGTFQHFGNISETTERYLELFSDRTDMYRVFEKPIEEQEGKDICLTKAFVSDLEGSVLLDPTLDVRKPFYLNFEFVFTKTVKSPKLTFHFKNKMDEFVWFNDIRDNVQELPSLPGKYAFKILIPQPLLKPDIYSIYVGITNEDNNQTNHFSTVLKLEFVDLKGIRESRAGYLYTESKWNLVL